MELESSVSPSWCAKATMKVSSANECYELFERRLEAFWMVVRALACMQLLNANMERTICGFMTVTG